MTSVMKELLKHMGAVQLELSVEAKSINPSIEDWLNHGWTFDLMVEAGHLVPVTDDKRDYSKLVNNLAKNGSDVVSGLTSDSAHMLHMVVGLVGEIGELIEGVNNDDLENMHEECGDIEFYYQALADIFGIDADAPTCGHIRQDLPPMVLIMIHGTRLLDAVKKHAIYEKAIDMNIAVSEMHDIRKLLNACYEMYNTTRDEIINANMDKLLKRYPSGTYTNNDAQSRADKTQ